jgi:predicted PurR-regulated permease PerM
VNARLQTSVHVSILALIIGWVLHIGKGIFVPIVFSMLVVYVMIGITRLLAKTPVIGKRLPLQVRGVLSVVVISLLVAAMALLVLANIERLRVLAPQYQVSLLATIQSLAVRFGVENEPTWATLRQIFLDQVSVQSLVGTTMASASSLIGSAIVVGLYVTFLLVEQGSFAAKIDNVSADPRHAALLRQIIANINARVGSYLALKAVLGATQGLISFFILWLCGVEFAAFWGVVIAMLNFVPYIGSMLSVALPVLLAVVQFGDFNSVLVVLVSLSVLQFFIGNFLDPYLMGNSLNLSPFVILVSLTVWSALWGVAGAFLAIPITAVMAIIFSEFSETRPLAILLSRNGTLSNG